MNMKRNVTDDGTDRGQAYTLEGFIGAMVVLVAVLFALQAVVITPTTGGLADRSVQAQAQQEAQDALVVADEDGNLSETLRRWDGNGFEGTDERTQGGEAVYSASAFANVSTLGDVLNQSFAEQGWNYNVELHYEDDGGMNTTTLVYQGSPSSDAITASHVVTLHDDQYVEPDREETISAYEEDNDPPIPREVDDDENPIYNVVEVRVTLW